MSAWAKPGVKCVCVDGRWPDGAWYGDERLPEQGATYTIREIVWCDGVMGCRLEELVNSPRDYQQGVVEAAFALYRFRPLITRTQEDDVRLIKSLLISDAGLVPAGVEVDA